jgi:hypothetical protein
MGWHTAFFTNAILFFLISFTLYLYYIQKNHTKKIGTPQPGLEPRVCRLPIQYVCVSFKLLKYKSAVKFATIILVTIKVYEAFVSHWIKGDTGNLFMYLIRIFLLNILYEYAKQSQEQNILLIKNKMVVSQLDPCGSGWSI